MKNVQMIFKVNVVLFFMIHAQIINPTSAFSLPINPRKKHREMYQDLCKKKQGKLLRIKCYIKWIEVSRLARKSNASVIEMCNSARKLFVPLKYLLDFYKEWFKTAGTAIEYKIRTEVKSTWERGDTALRGCHNSIARRIEVGLSQYNKNKKQTTSLCSLTNSIKRERKRVLRLYVWLNCISSTEIQVPSQFAKRKSKRNESRAKLKRKIGVLKAKVDNENRALDRVKKRLKAATFKIAVNTNYAAKVCMILVEKDKKCHKKNSSLKKEEKCFQGKKSNVEFRRQAGKYKITVDYLNHSGKRVEFHWTTFRAKQKIKLKAVGMELVTKEIVPDGTVKDVRITLPIPLQRVSLVVKDKKRVYKGKKVGIKIITSRPKKTIEFTLDEEKKSVFLPIRNPAGTQYDFIFKIRNEGCFCGRNSEMVVFQRLPFQIEGRLKETENSKKIKLSYIGIHTSWITSVVVALTSGVLAIHFYLKAESEYKQYIAPYNDNFKKNWENYEHNLHLAWGFGIASAVLAVLGSVPIYFFVEKHRRLEKLGCSCGN